MQEFDGIETPIAHASKTLTETQKRYSQIEREALAIVFGVKKFHQFLYGRKFLYFCTVQKFEPTPPIVVVNKQLSNFVQ